MLAAGMEEEEEALKALVALQPCFSRFGARIARPCIPSLGNLPFLLCFQKRHLEMLIISTLRQQSVLRGLTFQKPHVSTHKVYCYSVFSFSLLLCDLRLCGIARNDVDPCLVLRGLAIRIGKWYPVTAFRKPPA